MTTLHCTLLLQALQRFTPFISKKISRLLKCYFTIYYCKKNGSHIVEMVFAEDGRTWVTLLIAFSFHEKVRQFKFLLNIPVLIVVEVW